MHRTILTVVALLALFIDAAATNASVVVPAVLGPGATYQLAFVTSGAHNAMSDVIAVYNDFVQDQAALNSGLTGTDMGVTWKAIASTPSVDARDNALILAPVFLLDGSTKIAESFADMWDGTLANPIRLDQFLSGVSRTAWTGSSPSGVNPNPFVALGSSTGNTLIGRSDASDAGWIDFLLVSRGSDRNLYALSEVLTVPPLGGVVPEPSSALVWLVLGGGGLSMSYWHRRRRTKRGIKGSGVGCSVCLCEHQLA